MTYLERDTSNKLLVWMIVVYEEYVHTIVFEETRQVTLLLGPINT